MMNYSWDNVFEYFKDRRLAGIYFGALSAILGVLLLVAFVYQATSGLSPLSKYLPMFLPGVGLLLLAFFWRVFRHARRQRRNRYKSSPLSRDELAKARSKLKANSTSKSS